MILRQQIKILIFTLVIISSSVEAQNVTKYKKLTAEESSVILHKGTEQPFSGKYENFYKEGIYHCKRCNAPLYRSSDKFDAHCGWPSFDDEIEGAIVRKLDADGKRTEILCANCGAHLGHVFIGEHFTEKNVRHCVNSISLVFEPTNHRTLYREKKKPADTAFFAGGCFWGMQFYFDKAKGVKSTLVGYIGGHKNHPTYTEVCTHTTGHVEAVEVIFNPNKTNFETLAKFFFEIHDPTQINRQGPDVGEQYKSVIFYRNKDQKQISKKLIRILKDKGYDIVTELIPATTFWTAENYHQKYYEHNGHRPYCHFYKKKF